MRCFLAIPITEPALGRMQRLLGDLQAEIDGGRFVRGDGLHITIHFLGNVPESMAQRAVLAVEPVAATSRPFDVTLSRLGAFPNARNPRVLWAGADDESNAELRAFASRCRTALHEAGFQVEERPFVAHCTVARVRSWSGDDAERWHRAAAGMQPTSFGAGSLVLYESKTHPAGAVYEQRRVLDLAGRISAGAGQAAPSRSRTAPGQR